MTRKDFENVITDLVQAYIEGVDSFDANPQLRINPASLNATLVNGKDMYTEIEYSNEAIEDAAAAAGDETEAATDFQASQNPDFYAVRKLLMFTDDGKTVVDQASIKRIADQYFSN